MGDNGKKPGAVILPGFSVETAFRDTINGKIIHWTGKDGEETVVGPNAVPVVMMDFKEPIKFFTVGPEQALKIADAIRQCAEEILGQRK